MRAFSLILIIVLSSIKHHTAAEMKFYSGDYGRSNNQQTYEINDANRMWKNLRENWRKGNENVMDNYHTQNMIPLYYGKSDSNAPRYPSFNNYKYNGDLTTVDKRLWKIFNEQGTTGKRQSQGMNNKREGNWNNLRGLWGKRSGSSWDKLHTSWGRK